MKKRLRLIIGVTTGFAIGATATVINDVTFNETAGTPLSGVNVGKGNIETFSETATLDAYGATDGSALVWSNMTSGSVSSYGNLGGVFTTNDTDITLRSTVRISDFNFDAENGSGATVGLGIGDGAKLAYLQLGVGGTGNEVQIKAEFSDGTTGTEEASTIQISSDDTLNMTALGWTGLQIRMDINLGSDTYSLFYLREGVDTEFQAGNTNVSFGLTSGNSGFVALDKMRIGTQNAFLAESSVKIDQWTIETLPMNGVYVKDQDGGAFEAGTNALASFTVEAGDVLVVSAVDQGANKLEEDSLMITASTAWLGAAVSDEISNFQEARLWRIPVLSSGTVDLSFAAASAQSAVGAYLLRSTSGQVDFLALDLNQISSGGSVTNTYDTGELSDGATGVYIEAAISNPSGSPLVPENSGTIIDYEDNLYRRVASGSFSGQTLTNVWQIADASRKVQLAGYVFGPGVPVSGVVVADIDGNDLNSGTNALASFVVEAGDMVVVSAIDQGPGKLTKENLFIAASTADLGTTESDEISAYQEARLWRIPVLGSGAVDLSFAASGQGVVAAYLLRSTSGPVEFLGSALNQIPSGAAVTNIYDAAALPDGETGIYIEAVISNPISVLTPVDPGAVIDYQTSGDSGNYRRLASGSFTGKEQTNIWLNATTDRKVQLAGYTFGPGGVATPTSLYEDWLAENGYSVDAKEENLIEYASGGSVTLPVGAEEGGFFIHVHTEWLNAGDRGLVYELKLDQNANLTNADWLTNGVVFVNSGDVPGNDELLSVTNQVPSTDAQEFLRLNVTFTP